MNDLTVKNTTQIFDKIKHLDPEGREFWFASDLMSVLEYEKWEKFLTLIKRAEGACEKSGFQIKDHFLQVTKIIKLGKTAERTIADYALDRYACYLIAQNGDPTKKKNVALAQSYFAYQTRKQEIQEKNFSPLERVLTRQKLTTTEKEFAHTLFQQGISGSGVAIIRDAGDKALFGGKSTQKMKKQLGINSHRPLADFLPTITLKAKDLATEMTTFKTKEQDLKDSVRIKYTHVSHNTSIRKVLTEEGIFPENLPPAEDIKKLEKRMKSDQQYLPEI